MESIKHLSENELYILEYIYNHQDDEGRIKNYFENHENELLLKNLDRKGFIEHIIRDEDYKIIIVSVKEVIADYFSQ